MENLSRGGTRQTGLKISGLNELRECLERLRPEEVMARALAEQAQRMAARVREGLSEPPGGAGHDEPWLRTGALRDSVGAQAEGLQAAVGSSDPAAVPQEMGTTRMPARPFLAPVAAGMGEEVARAVGAAVAAALRGDSLGANGTGEQLPDAIQVSAPSMGAGFVPLGRGDAVGRVRAPSSAVAVGRNIGAAPPTASSTAPAAQPTPTSDFEQKQQIALSFVRAGGNATSADAVAMARHLASVMSASQLQKMRAAGIHVVVSRDSVTDYLTSLKGVHPRGYPPGLTWDIVPGTVWGNNEVVTATHAGPNGERELPGTTQSASADVTLHEIGHAINRQAGTNWASDRADFREAYGKDAGTGPLSDPYYHQEDAAAGRDEAFAESHAEFLKDPTTMKARYPNLYAYWNRYYGMGK